MTTQEMGRMSWRKLSKREKNIIRDMFDLFDSMGEDARDERMIHLTADSLVWLEYYGRVMGVEDNPVSRSIAKRREHDAPWQAIENAQ